MFEKLKSTLAFLRLLDSDGTISLTSVALCVMLYRVATCSEISMTELGAFLAAVANYSGKRFINARSGESELAEQVAALGTKVQALAIDTATVMNRTQPVRR